MSRETSNIPLTDLYHATSLAYEITVAFDAVAPKIGVRLEGLPYDANEYALFWQHIAAHILKVKPPADD